MRRVIRRAAVVFLIVCAAGLAVWIPYLGFTLGQQYTARRWGIAWVGLDVAEALGLLVTALLLHRRSAYAAVAATATSVLFLVDAWFDTTTSVQGRDYGESLVFALAAELPIGVVCAVLAIMSVRRTEAGERARDRSGSARPRGRS